MRLILSLTGRYSLQKELEKTIKLEYNGTDFVKKIQHDLSDKELELLKETQDD